jgi:hypothetical protein
LTWPGERKDFLVERSCKKIDEEFVSLDDDEEFTSQHSLLSTVLLREFFLVSPQLALVRQAKQIAF